MHIYYVYILKCSDDSFYTGITSHLENRLNEHETGHYKTCYTFRRRPLKLQFHQEFNNVLQAIRFEKQVKGWSRAKKTALISGNFDLIQILAECRNASHHQYKPLSL